MQTRGPRRNRKKTRYISHYIHSRADFYRMCLRHRVRFRRVPAKQQTVRRPFLFGYCNPSRPRTSCPCRQGYLRSCIHDTSTWYHWTWNWYRYRPVVTDPFCYHFYPNHHHYFYQYRRVGPVLMKCDLIVLADFLTHSIALHGSNKSLERPHRTSIPPTRALLTQLLYHDIVAILNVRLLPGKDRRSQHYNYYQRALNEYLPSLLICELLICKPGLQRSINIQFSIFIRYSFQHYIYWMHNKPTYVLLQLRWWRRVGQTSYLFLLSWGIGQQQPQLLLLTPAVNSCSVCMLLSNR